MLGKGGEFFAPSRAHPVFSGSSSRALRNGIEHSNALGIVCIEVDKSFNSCVKVANLKWLKIFASVISSVSKEENIFVTYVNVENMPVKVGLFSTFVKVENIFSASNL